MTKSSQSYLMSTKDKRLVNRTFKYTTYTFFWECLCRLCWKQEHTCTGEDRLSHLIKYFPLTKVIMLQNHTAKNKDFRAPRASTTLTPVQQHCTAHTRNLRPTYFNACSDPCHLVWFNDPFNSLPPGLVTKFGNIFQNITNLIKSQAVTNEFLLLGSIFS